MALSAAVIHKEQLADQDSYRVANAEVIWSGALVGVNASGLLVNWEDVAGTEFKGVAHAKDDTKSVTGDTSAAIPPEMQVDQRGIILRDQSVTGVTGIGDVNALVYATDENTLTLTATTNVKAIGYITRYKSNSNVDVKLFTPDVFKALN